MSTIELTFLGTTAGIPTRKRAHPAIHLRYTGRGEHCCLFDCGEGVQRQFLFARINPMKLKAIFISHWHADHYLGLPGLVDTLGFESRTEPLRIFSPEPVRTKTLLGISYTEPPFPLYVAAADAFCPEPVTLMEEAEYVVQSFPVMHTVPAIGYVFQEKEKIGIDKQKLERLGLPLESPVYRNTRLDGSFVIEGREIAWQQVLSRRRGKKVVYSGDTAICDQLRQAAAQADLLIQDCTYFEQVKANFGHACLDDVLAMVERIGVKRVVLTHISRRYDNHEQLARLVSAYPQVVVATDFMRALI